MKSDMKQKLIDAYERSFEIYKEMADENPDKCSALRNELFGMVSLMERAEIISPEESLKEEERISTEFVF